MCDSLCSWMKYTVLLAAWVAASVTLYSGDKATSPVTNDDILRGVGLLTLTLFLLAEELKQHLTGLHNASAQDRRALIDAIQSVRLTTPPSHHTAVTPDDSSGARRRIT